MFINILEKLMKEKNLNKSELSKQSNIPYTTIDGLFKKGCDNTKLTTLRQLARFFNVSIDFLVDEDKPNKILHLDIAEKYTTLDEHGKEAVSAVLETEIKRMKTITAKKIIKYPVTGYEQSASAGGGNYLNYEYGSIMYITEEPPSDTSFMVKVSGDSMEPTYYNGDYIFVNKDTKPSVGEVGLWIYQSYLYVKEYSPDGLISHNPKYELIKCDESTECIGKVVGSYSGIVSKF